MKKIFRENIGDHVLALLLALALWFFVKSTSTPVRPVDASSVRFSGIAIETRNRAPELDLATPITTTASLTIRAPQDILDKITKQDLVTYVDLRSLQEGTHQLSIRVDVPAGVEVVSAMPARLEIVLEEIISTQVPVSLSLVGELVPGFFAPPGIVEPATVVVTGARSMVGNLAPLVIVIDASELTDTVTASVGIQPFNREGQPLQVTMNPPQVQYRQPIYPTKSVPIAVISNGGFAPGVTDVRFELITGEAVVAALPDILQGISTLEVAVDTSQVKQNTSIEVMLAPPSGTYLVSHPAVTIRMIVVSGP